MDSRVEFFFFLPCVRVCTFNVTYERKLGLRMTNGWWNKVVLANSFRSFELVKVAIYHKTVYSSASLRKIASFILLLIAAGCRDHRCSNIVVSVINLIFFNQMKANVDCSCSRNIVKSIHQNCCAHRFFSCFWVRRAIWLSFRWISFLAVRNNVPMLRLSCWFSSSNS